METEDHQWSESQTDEDSDAEDTLSGFCETESLHWSQSQTDEDSDLEESGIYGSYSAGLSCHPQLETDIQAVRTSHSDSAVSVREFGTIDCIDVDLKIDPSFLDTEVAKAWNINPSEAIVIRLQLSMSQYLDGPVPSVEVFQPSNDHFSVGHQLQSILRLFISREWKHVSNENIVIQPKKRLGLSAGRVIRRFCTRLSIRPLLSKLKGFRHPAWRGRIVLTGMKLSNRRHCAAAYTIKNRKGVLTYRPSGKRVLWSAVKSSAQASTKQPMALSFPSLARRRRKTIPILQHGFLAQIMRYAEQRIPSLNEYCVVCDEKHLFQYGPMLKPAVCTRDLCVYSFHTLGVMKGATEVVATGAEVVDLLVAMCRAAVQSSRRSLIFDPYPSVVDPSNPQMMAFSPKTKNYDKLEKVLGSVLMLTRMAQGSYAEMKKHVDKVEPLAHPLLQWILSSNRSHIVKLPQHKQLTFMHTPHQFLLISSPPSKEASFRIAKEVHGSTFAFHGSHIENWHSILRHGLVNASQTNLQLHGASYGNGIYLSPVSTISFGYTDMGKGRYQKLTRKELKKEHKQEQPGNARFLESMNLSCIALCEVITSTNLRKNGSIWVCPIPDHVCTRFLFVYENSQVEYMHVNTQDSKIQKELLQVIASPC